MINDNSNPSLEEIAATFMANMGKYMEMDYDPVPECQRPLTPSREIEILSTLYKEPYSKMKFHTGKDSDGVSDLATVRKTKEDKWIILVRTSTRQDVDTKAYKFRNLRMEGVRLDTVLFNDGARGKVRMFPNAQGSQVRAEREQR